MLGVFAAITRTSLLFLNIQFSYLYSFLAFSIGPLQNFLFIINSTWEIHFSTLFSVVLNFWECQSNRSSKYCVSYSKPCLIKKCKTVSFSSFFALQPQNSMPDVVVWLISGTKRIASFRIPAYDVLYSPNVESCGQYCSKVFNMFMKVTIQFVVRLLVYFQRGIDRDSWVFLFLIILLLWQNARICGKKEFIQDWQTILSCCWNVFTNKKRRFSIFESPIIHSVWPSKFVFIVSKCSWEDCIFLRAFENINLCKTLGANVAYYGDSEVFNGTLDSTYFKH